jgi:hypothetical protein
MNNPFKALALIKSMVAGLLGMVAIHHENVATGQNFFFL